jgi:hypothetical protein
VGEGEFTHHGSAGCNQVVENGWAMTGSLRMLKSNKPTETQAERFADAARAAGGEEDEAAFDRKLKEIALAREPVVHAPDCPARERPADPELCICGAAPGGR